jgi:hypothetical protein
MIIELDNLAALAAAAASASARKPQPPAAGANLAATQGGIGVRQLGGNGGTTAQGTGKGPSGSPRR